MPKGLGRAGFIAGLMALALSIPAFADRIELVAPAASEVLLFRDATFEVRFALAREEGTYKRIVFSLTNLTDSAIAVDWNRCSIVLPSGEASSVLHEGVRFMSAKDPTPPTTVPPASRLTESVIPTTSISYSSSEGWRVAGLGLYTGATFGLYLSLDVGGETRGYNFRFAVQEYTMAPAQAVVEDERWLQDALLYLLAAGLLLGLLFLLKPGD